MMMRKSTFIMAASLAGLILLSACQPVSIYTQRATATAYSSEYMTSAMQAAENGAMALCNIDFNAGGETYLEQICAVSTDLGCAFYGDQVPDVWNDLARSYTSDILECEVGTSRLLEEGEQFGMRVQYWHLNLVGTKGWTEGARNREYWVQVAEENSNWKLNRILTSDEVAYYLAIDSMGAEE